MLFTTTIKILMVRTGSVQSCHQTPIFPYRGRARQTIILFVWPKAGMDHTQTIRAGSRKGLLWHVAELPGDNLQ